MNKHEQLIDYDKMIVKYKGIWNFDKITTDNEIAVRIAFSFCLTRGGAGAEYLASILINKYSYMQPSVDIWWLNTKLDDQVRMLAFNVICFDKEPHKIQGGWELMKELLEKYEVK
ncbi:hypothetical protein [Candidatus Uabimicrobium amorphum]|uniref:Uncharacterized protein n=1 Tax=Uabimicrobium amorphum TaxID=2596890 RepID=A0A5S9IT20_UABAM|nr:hypothetical protein [Candidatus Uabimicrobium amorphum]BBM87106.1 hypothetical protein UABAM_05509 [Candidatus Uabimicrobium amorphum]